MSIKGSITIADYLPYDDYKRLVQTLVDEKNYLWATYCILSFCTGLRYSDVSRIKWSDILEKRKLVITAQKTNKTHSIPLGSNASEHLQTLYEKLGKPDKDSIIISTPGTKGKPMKIQYVNRILKAWVHKYDLNIENFSTHTFRKTFGRYVYDKGGRDDRALLYLNRIFKHKNLETTMVYLGIRDEEISSIFNTIAI